MTTPALRPSRPAVHRTISGTRENSCVNAVDTPQYSVDPLTGSPGYVTIPAPRGLGEFESRDPLLRPFVGNRIHDFDQPRSGLAVTCGADQMILESADSNTGLRVGEVVGVAA